ncbi:hypothetical protein KFU94_47905 [Chloroflexi bacterium TSY]|nr:hypothetical protein [Chloroflexi bacterium TSY]
MLTSRGLTDTFATETALVMRASGSPLALKLIIESIQDFFDGDIRAFLTDETFIFDDVRDVLDQQFNRLAPLEQTILLWLAIEREDVPLSSLQQNLVPQVARRDFLEAVRSLERRSLLEKTARGLTLQNMVSEYLTDRLITAICREIETETPQLFISHPLCKALTKEYIHQSQLRLIVEPITEQLENKLGRITLLAVLSRLLDAFRNPSSTPSADVRQSYPANHYASGNLLNLLLTLEVDLHDWNFTHLPVRQARLRQANLSGIDFRYAAFSETTFTDVFGLIHAVAFRPTGES